MRVPLALLAVAATLAACTVGPDYRRPDLEPPAAFRNAAAPTAAVDPSAPWWRAFGDPVLDALETQALAQNLDIAAATARVGQARAV